MEEEILRDKINNNYIKNTSAYERYKEMNIKNDIIKFYYQYNHLKNLYRQGWLTNLIGKHWVSKTESVADHTWSMTMFCLTIIEKYKLNYDVEKCLKLCTIHELGEIYAGDYTPEQNLSSEDKHNREKKAILKLLEEVEFSNDFLEIWEEYEKNETPEAKLIKEIDKLECLMQASCYGLNIKYMKKNLEKLTIPCLKEIAEEVIQLTKNNEVPLSIRKNENK